MYISLICVFLVCICALCSAKYVVPPSQVEVLKPKGLQISIPDQNGISSFYIYGIVNSPFQRLNEGDISPREYIKKQGNRWIFEDKNVKLKEGDVIHYWIYVALGKSSYYGLDRSYKVTNFSDNGHPATPPQGGCDSYSYKNSNSTVLGVSPCKGDLIFETNFLGTIVDPNVWFQEERFGGSDYEDVFVMFLREKSYMPGRLEIRPSLCDKTYSKSFVRKGKLFLGGCTSNDETYCDKNASSFMIMPPILTARQSTKFSFTFQYGEIEIKAKLPQGDWIVPELWLEPKEAGNTGRIVIALARGNNVLSADGKDISAKTLTAGVVFKPGKSHMITKESAIPWTQDFHVYKVRWTYSGMTFLVDNQEIGKISSHDSYRGFVPFNKEYYITLGVHVGGLKDFPDSETKPWKNNELKAVLKFWLDELNWYKTWNKDSKLIVEYVKVWAL